MTLRGLALLFHFAPSRFDGRVKGMNLLGLVLLCPLTPYRDCCIPSFGR